MMNESTIKAPLEENNKFSQNGLHHEGNIILVKLNQMYKLIKLQPEATSY